MRNLSRHNGIFQADFKCEKDKEKLAMLHPKTTALPFGKLPRVSQKASSCITRSSAEPMFVIFGTRYHENNIF